MEEPLLVNPSKGGFRTMPFIIGSMGLAGLAYWGIASNMIIYLTKDYRMQMAKGSNIIILWEATCNFIPILGAFLADSYVGRFRMVGFGSIISFLGMVQFWSTTIIPGAKPNCDGLNSNNCTSTKPLQLTLLFSSLALIAIGSGAGRSASLAFGADQLRSDKEHSSSVLESYINWFYVVCFSTIILAQTCIVYIEDHMGWLIGFGLSTLFMFLSVIIFFWGSPHYIKSKPKDGFLTGLAQVVVASWRNRHFDVSSFGNKDGIMYHVAEGSEYDMPSDKLKFLNKACIIKEERVIESTNICTVTQVEELKSLINIIPLWSTGFILNINLNQGSFRVIQASSMDRHLFTSSFEIPPASFGIFGSLTMVLWLALYDTMFLKIASKVMGKSVHLSVKSRMGVGLILTIVSLVVSAIVESIRLGMVRKGDDMSAMWLLPQICLFGLAEGFSTTAQNEFFYSELPKGMSSVSSNLYSLGMAIAGYLASLIVSVVDNVTRWLSNDPNKGHYDYYYWVLTCLSLLNYMYFLLCCRAYGHRKRTCHE